MIKKTMIKGRGAQINTDNPFSSVIKSKEIFFDDDTDIKDSPNTDYILTHPKTVVNKVTSPDVGMEYSINPYQGCEHGCIYCYARNTHTYWGYSAGIEFEQKILVKENAPELLEKKLKSKNWYPVPIVLSGNTDCYQPAEKKYQLTRKMLEILWKYKHPTGIITKNYLVTRDLDILSKMANLNLIKVSISITTLNESLRQKMEPRTVSGQRRIKAVEVLANEGVPVNVMMAPIIPSINDQEIFEIAEKSALAGAISFNHTLVRLNGQIAEIFTDWIKTAFPDKAERVIHQIESCHGGKMNDSRFGQRMRGEGNVADIIKQQVKMAKTKYFKGKEWPKYNTELYSQIKNPQLTLF